MRCKNIGLGIGVVLALAVGAAPKSLAAQGATLQGTVTDAASKAPVADAKVSIVGTRLQGVTNIRGEYRITGIPAGTVGVQVQRIGYKALQTTITLAEGQEFTGDYPLTASVVLLEEIVVTGTAGEQQRKTQPAVVADVKASDIVPIVPITSVSDVLQSRVPGVSVTSASGSSGTSNQIRIRGVASINLSNEPLLYVDGVRVSSGGLPYWFTGGQSYERLNDIEPSDIESMEIVKGPAAATLYGADATAGVIQIITKRGRAGAGRFTQSLTLESGPIYRNFYPRTNFGRCSAANVTDNNNYYCAGEAVGTLVHDNPLMRENAFRTGHNTGINWSGRGGGANYGYYTSLNKETEDGVLPNNGFDRSSGRINFNWLPGKSLTLDAGIGITVSTADLPDNDNNIFGWLGNSHLGSPLTRTVDGTLQNGWFGNQRDVAAMTAIDNSRFTHRTIASVTANWAPRNNFTHRLTAGLDWGREEDQRFLPKNTRNSYPINTGQIQEARRGLERYTIDYLATLNNSLSATVSSGLSVGFQLIDGRDELVFATGEGLPVNSNDVVTAASTRSGGQEITFQRTVGVIGQWQVALNNRLYGQVGVRFDNASSFGRDASWVALPKFGVSWVASQESFWKVSFMNTLRLRGAWGSTGRIPQPGASLTTLQPAPYYDGSIVSAGAIPLNPGNPGLQFERGSELELGFDAGFFNDRAGLEVTYFNKISENLLIQQPLPPSKGYPGNTGNPNTTGNPWVNVGGLVNRGVEVAFRAVPVNSPSIIWDIRLGANTLHNEVRDMDTVPAFGTLNRVQKGYQLGSWWTRKILSVDTSTNIVRVSEDPTFAGNVLPTFEANFSTNVTIMRNLRFYGLIDTKQGYKVRNFTDFFRETQLVRSDNRLDPTKLSKTERLRRYGNPTAGAPAFLTPLDSARTVNDVQEAYLQDGAFVRLRELSLTYTVPDRWARVLRASAASITIAGQNLGLWTNYGGYDPEVVSNTQGVSDASFNRDDFFTQPPVRRGVFRVNLTF